MVEVGISAKSVDTVTLVEQTDC